MERFTAGYDYKKFIADEKTRDAVVRNFEILGEAASRFPEELRSKFQQIEWTKIIGLRNRVVHEYFGVDLDIVWRIIKNGFAPLKRLLKESRTELK